MDDTGRLRTELPDAANDLTGRVDVLSRVVRYATKEVAGHRLLDLDRARERVY